MQDRTNPVAGILHMPWPRYTCSWERTSLIVVNDASADDLSTRREDLFKLELGQRAWQTADVQVSILDTLAARPRVGHLHLHAHVPHIASFKNF